MNDGWKAETQVRKFGEFVTVTLRDADIYVEVHSVKIGELTAVNFYAHGNRADAEELGMATACWAETVDRIRKKRSQGAVST